MLPELDADILVHQRTGYSATQSLKSYAMYLDSRITCYRALKHDPIRVQSENNRMSVYDGPAGGECLAPLCFLFGEKVGLDGECRGWEADAWLEWVIATGKPKKLNSLSVDKGLLREVREVQKVMASLVLCRVSSHKAHQADVAGCRVRN
jgi:hypothetical protein